MSIELLIRNIAWFRGLSASSQKALASICVDKKARKREILFHEGQKGEAVYILFQGAVRLFKTSMDGREIAIRMVQPGELFAELVLFEKDVYPVSAAAMSDSRLFVIPRHRFHELLAQEDFRNDFVGDLLQKQRHLMEQILSLTSQDVESRLMLFLKEQFGTGRETEVTLSKKDIASAIGTTPETLSRLILKLNRQKKIVWKGKMLKIPNFLN